MEIDGRWKREEQKHTTPTTMLLPSCVREGWQRKIRVQEKGSLLVLGTNSYRLLNGFDLHSKRTKVNDKSLRSVGI